MSFDEYLALIKNGSNLKRADAEAFLSYILDDQDLPEEQIATALTALTKKTVTVAEVCGFVDAMKQRMTHITAPEGSIDTCGTGGDKSGTFNISTAVAIVLAAGGVPVAKHGNRAATSKCGSADILEALKIPIDLEPQAAEQYLADHNFVFLFAPQYHPALKRLVMVRKQLGFPTVFNLLGPLLNPAGVKRQVIGTFNLDNARSLASVMQQMNYEHAIVLTSEDGLDEASLGGRTHIFEVKGAELQESTLQAADFKLEPATSSELQGDDAPHNAAIITQALQSTSELSAPQRVIMLNAALGFYVAGKSPTIKDGVIMAQDVLTNGKAAAKLQEMTT